MAFSSPSANIVLGFSILWVLSWLVRIVFRLYFHPLARFPGPRLAAATGLYEIYYDVIKHGKYVWEINRMHQVYGPIVRVTPEELHILDPDYLNTIYAGSWKKRDKDPNAVANIPHTLVGAKSHGEHRWRRRVWGTYFTRAAIRKVEPLIQEKAQRLIQRFQDYAQSGKPVNLKYAFFAYACDTITMICLGQDWKQLDQDEFGADFADASMAIVKSFKIMTHIKWAVPIIREVPPWVARPFWPYLSLILSYRPKVKKSVHAMLRAEPGHNMEKPGQPLNVFRLASDDPKTPHELRTPQQLARDADLFIGAGEGSSGYVLAIIWTYLLLAPEKLQRVRMELADPRPDGFQSEWDYLSELPYISACVKEGLRLQHGLTKRLPRSAPDEALVYRDWVIPPGTPISTMHPLIHLNDSVFHDAWDFLPERWLECDPQRLRYLESKVIAFSRGSRNCLGKELALAEIYIGLAATIRALDLELFETGKDDVEMVSDQVILEPRRGSVGPRVLVRACVENVQS